MRSEVRSRKPEISNVRYRIGGIKGLLQQRKKIGNTVYQQTALNCNIFTFLPTFTLAESTNKELIIYTDGASRGNPGPGGRRYFNVGRTCKRASGGYRKPPITAWN